ncbi:MAG: GNAT family N-acetyltransferase, partial [Clostridiales bacterium]|nr:GNAT family N-acetyltransferase [Clostridiales bacterium]
VEPLYPYDEELEYQKNYISHMYHYYGYGMWLVFEKKSGKLIGRAGIENRLYPEGMGMELGYVIHPKWQKKGIATEVCRAIIDYAAEKLGCQQLNLLTDGGNAASAALARKLGFSCVGETDVTGTVLERYQLKLR